jgi:capsid protein
MPFNVAAGNSSSYNYASGRLDHQIYYKSIGIDQYQIETTVLRRLFRAWLAEARLAIPNLVPADFTDRPPMRWFWDGREHVDPVKEATAQQQRLASSTTTLEDEWAARGYDWREKLQQRAEEIKFAAELGLPPPPQPKLAAMAELLLDDDPPPDAIRRLPA